MSNEERTKLGTALKTIGAATMYVPESGNTRTVPIYRMFIVLKDDMPKPLTAKQLRAMIPHAKSMR